MGGRRMGTSCKPCQKARIGCDAVLQKDSPCSNCVRRGKVCNTQANLDVEQYHRRRPHPTTSGRHALMQNVRSVVSPDSPLSSERNYLELEDVASRRAQASVLHEMLWDIFVSIFETRFALWLGDSCCPYLDMQAGTKALVSRIAVQLDGFQCDSDAHSNPDVSDLFATSPGISTGSNNSTASLNDALRYAIYAYSVRWLPLRSAFESSNAGSAARAQRQQQEVRDQLWRQVRERIFLAISRPSYRSILTLFLFTLTEMPLDNDDPGLGDLCTEVMLNHFIRLRSPFKLPRVSPLAQSTMALPLAQGAVDFIMPRKRSDNDLKYQHLQDSIFWLGVVCDTSRSLIHHSPSVILPGRSGDRKVWGFIRQRTVIFDQSFRVLHGSAQPLPADIIVVVLQHASACKTMYLGVVNQFYEAAFHVNGESVEDAAGRVAEESRRFQDVFDPLLVMCARDYLTMKPESQLHYILLLTHYHLGTLIFVDALDALDTTPEALKDLKSSRSQACSAIVNALSLAMSCDRYSDDDSPYGSILLLDPTPELMVEVLSRAGKAILSLYQSEKLRLQTAQVMLSVVFSALTVLMKLSVTASFVLSSLHALRSKQNLKIKNDDQCTTAGPIACPRDIPLLSACDSTFIDEFLRESQIQANIDPLHLDRTINKYEDLETRLGGMSGDTTSSQLQMVKDLSPSYAVNCSTVLNKAVWNSRGQCSGF